jgi:hypothetical protein
MDGSAWRKRSLWFALVCMRVVCVCVCACVALLMQCIDIFSVPQVISPKRNTKILLRRRVSSCRGKQMRSMNRQLLTLAAYVTDGRRATDLVSEQSGTQEQIISLHAAAKHTWQMSTCRTLRWLFNMKRRLRQWLRMMNRNGLGRNRVYLTTLPVTQTI